MPEMRTSRLVSGEIMSRPAAKPRAVAGHDVVDAEFETLGNAPADTARSRASAGEAVGAEPGLATLRAATPSPRRLRWQRAGMSFWLGGIAIAAAAFWVSGGHALFDLRASALVRAAASPLRIVDVTSRVETAAARSVLLVDGEARNDDTRQHSLPPLSIEVTAPDGSRTRYRLGTSGRYLQEGERFAFSGRFEVPKEGVKTVSVTFVE